MFNTKLILCAGAGVVALVATAARADSFNVKPGAWESTSTSTTTGIMIPQDMLSKMPPERRAKIEEAMRAQSGKARTTTHKYCVTEKDLDEDRLFKDPRDNQCSRKVLSKSSTRIDIEQTCGAAPNTMAMHATVEATSSTSVTMTADGQMQGGGKMHVEAKSHWLGASCAGIEKD
ncbi:MAG: hypothetical protein OJF60_001589 [Burkholderiaceae bacterium]|jgi:hypothetical protein|nr:MAG: hypothetical protein OJF60_001589 [Burkholderiaceae bacterium]